MPGWNEIMDDLGHLWKFDGYRVFLVEAGYDDQNGYPCGSYDEARAILKHYGYISK